MQKAAPEECPETRTESRRSFFFFGALAAAAMLPTKVWAQRQARRRAAPRPAPQPDGFKLVVPNENVAAAEDASPLNRLVRRATMGITPAELNRAKAMGYQGWLNYQLNYTRIDDSAVGAYVAQKWPYLAMGSDALSQLDQGQTRTQLQEAWVYRAAFSQRQLYERMVEFWSDHFNIDIDKATYYKLPDDRDVIRKYALGKFPDLLKASAHSPAMLYYLDQSASRSAAPNQNYAREIMELHTLGVDGGYTQTDVAELSRVLTGWSISGTPGQRGTFLYNPALHDNGNKTVLGVNIAGQTGAAGQSEGEQVLDILANHPSTARFIATKMLKWLLDPNPSETQIATIAGVYRATKGDIKAMVRAILNDGWLPIAPLKFKRPFHYLVSSLRATAPTTVASMATMNGQMTTMGQTPFGWDTPDGYPDRIAYWAGNVLTRWNFAVTLSTQNNAASIVVPTTAYLAGTPDNAIDLIDQGFFGGEMDPTERLALLNYLKAGTFNDTRVRETISLALSANGFQWY
jgi:uncharacterized protein (DUF1800 family)